MSRGLILLVSMCAGCGGERLHPVTGRVMLDGQPLTTGDVVLFPESGPLPSDRVPRGKIDADGRYCILTAGEAGALAGTYRVAVIAQTNQRPPNSPVNPFSLYPAIDPKFFRADQTPLRVEVRPSAPPGSYDLVVSR